MMLLGINMTKGLFDSENDLLRSLAEGDRLAFSRFYKSCFPYVKRMVLAMSGSVDDAYDVFQETAFVLYEKCNQQPVELSCKLSTFTVAIARKIWLKKVQSLGKEKLKEAKYQYVRDDFILDSHQMNREEIEEKEKKVENLEQALEELGEPCASVIRSFYIEGKNMKDIAEQFEYSSTDTAKTQKHKCLNRLRKIYFKYVDS